MPSPILHVRVDEEFIERIDALATQLRIDRSTAVRSLLAAALDDPKRVLVVREAMVLLSQQRKLILARFNDAIQDTVTGLREQLERDS